MIKDILEKHGVYTADLELDLLRHFEKLRNELLRHSEKPPNELQEVAIETTLSAPLPPNA